MTRPKIFFGVSQTKNYIFCVANSQSVSDQIVNSVNWSHVTDMQDGQFLVQIPRNRENLETLIQINGGYIESGDKYITPLNNQLL